MTNFLNVLLQAMIHSSDKPVSGYDLAKMIKNKTGNSHQQIYRELNKIGQRDDVVVDYVPQEGKPDKKLYSFKGKDGFSFRSGLSSDHTKSPYAYELAIEDALFGTDNYQAYIQHMTEAESKFKESL